MSEKLVITDEVFGEALNSVISSRSAFENAADDAGRAAGAVGHRGLENELHAFADNWRIHRERLVTKLTGLESELVTSRDEFTEADDSAARALQGGGGGSAAPAAPAPTAIPGAAATVAPPGGSGGYGLDTPADPAATSSNGANLHGADSGTGTDTGTDTGLSSEGSENGDADAADGELPGTTDDVVEVLPGDVLAEQDVADDLTEDLDSLDDAVTGDEYGDIAEPGAESGDGGALPGSALPDNAALAAGSSGGGALGPLAPLSPVGDLDTGGSHSGGGGSGLSAGGPLDLDVPDGAGLSAADVATVAAGGTALSGAAAVGGMAAMSATGMGGLGAAAGGGAGGGSRSMTDEERVREARRTLEKLRRTDKEEDA